MNLAKAESEAEAATAPEKARTPQPNSLEGMMKRLRLGQFSDFIIKCGDDEYKVHMAVICSRSTFFEKACFGSFKEASQSIIELKEDDPVAVNAMIEYFYLDNYLHIEVKPFKSDDWQPKELRMIPLHAQVYCLADKYDVPGLRVVAENNLDDALAWHPEWIETAHSRQAIRTVYEGTTEAASIREVFVNTIVRNRACVLNEELRDLILDYPALSEEAIVAFGSGPLNIKTQLVAHCQYCGEALNAEETLKLVVEGDSFLRSLFRDFGSRNHCEASAKHSWVLERVFTQGFGPITAGFWSVPQQDESDISIEGW